MDTNIATIFEPLNQHLQAIRSKTFTSFIGFLVVMTEPLSSVFLLDSTPLN